jgi:hypothetical protein
MITRYNQLHLASILCIVLFFVLFSCSRQGTVEDHFKNHGFNYPIDSSGVSMWSIDFVGIETEELSVPGAREYIEKGIMFAKGYFLGNKIHNYIPGASAAVLSNPVLFRDESGEVGLMVKITVFGEGKPDTKANTTVQRFGPERKLWRMENFIYFSHNELFRWEYNGMVY